MQANTRRRAKLTKRDLPTSGWLTAAEAAVYLSRTVETLKRWRQQGRGPDFTRREGRPNYSIAALNAWLEQGDDDGARVVGGR